jgi:class 3 adenylate cyclase/tetratricopeptide (TPR) repeat protein
MTTPGGPPHPGHPDATFQKWLEQIGLDHCAQLLLEQGIDFDLASTLTEEQLRICGVVRLGDRLRFIREAKRRQPTAVEASLGLEQQDSVTMQRGLNEAGERCQLTVMFCDLVGYTGLTQRFDGEVLNRMLGDYRGLCAKIVAHYDGAVAQILADGLMVYFGWPNAHEDDAERCVRSALDIMQAISKVTFAEPLAVHIGIATGIVVVGGASDDDAAAKGLAVGDTPALATRLQELAHAGEILVASTTLQLVGDRFELSDAGVHTLKGFVTPVQMWRVHAVRDNVWRFHAAHPGMKLTALIGRDLEVESLHRRWEWALNGEGQIVLLSGEAGIGKSRLAQAFRERIKDEAHVVLFYQCSAFRMNSPLYPFIQQLEFAAGFTHEDSPEEKLDKLEALLTGGAERAETAALFASLLSLPADRYPPLRVSPQRQKEKLLDALIGQLAALSRTKPVLIVFEDAHWIDPTTQELLDLLTPQLQSMRVLLILTYRPQYAPLATGYRHISRVDLTGLPSRLGTELVHAVAQGKALPQEVVQHIVARADGVPFFIEELTKSILESRFLAEESDHYTLLEPLRVLAIPTTLKGSLIERLGRRASVRELAQIGACIGREFAYNLLAAVSPYAGVEFDQELEHLTATGLVFRRGTPPDALYMFKHALVQDAAYDSLLNTKRQHLHATIAHVLESNYRERIAKEPEVVARHLTEAGNLIAAIPYWRRAGEAALARVALQEAVAYLEKGLEIVDRLKDAPEHDRLELSLRGPLHAARTRWHGWPAPDVRANATEMLRLAELTHDRQSLLVGLWGTWVSTITQGRVADAPEWAQRMLEEGEKHDELDLQILGHRAFVSSRFYLGELHRANEAGERVDALYDPSLARRLMELTASEVKTAVGVFWCQCLWVLGYPDRAVQLSDQKDADARLLGNPFDIGWALTWGAYVFDYRREPDRLLERVCEAERVGLEQSIPLFGRALVPIGRGLVMLRLGRLAESISLLQQGIAGWNASGGHLHEPYMKAALAEAFARQGDIATAHRLIDESLEQIHRKGWRELVWLPEVLRLKAWMLTSQGDVLGAETQLRASIDAARGQQARSWELRSATDLAELLAGRGDRQRAREALEPIYSWFTEGFDTHDLRAARALLEQLN